MTFIERHPAISAGLAFVAVGGIIAGCYGGKVLLSPVKGAGDVIIQQNDADSMINAQRELQDRYHGLAAACTKIEIVKIARDEDPNNFVAKTNYTAAKAHYVNLVGEYNALTQKYLAQNVLGNLPERVSVANCPGAVS